MKLTPRTGIRTTAGFALGAALNDKQRKQVASEIKKDCRSTR